MGPVDGQLELHFTITVHDAEALEAYRQRYLEDYPDERSILKALIWQSYNYNLRLDLAGTDGFADLPEGIVSVSWEPDRDLSIYHAGEWW